MVVRPDDILEKVLQRERPRLEAAEHTIDETLLARYDGGTVYVSGNVLDGIRSSASNALLAKYRTAGWKVTHESDFRESSYAFSRLIRQGDYHDR